MGFLVIIGFIIVWIIPMMKEANEDAQMRDWARKNNYDTYWSSTGCRYTSDGKKYDGKRTK
ncbi:MAG: hypothetical protein IKJ01_05300 [Lachnospiraceae bacterium]|nr:hypothetical protein [Lachnospiraceae bacterium]